MNSIILEPSTNSYCGNKFLFLCTMGGVEEGTWNWWVWGVMEGGMSSSQHGEHLIVAVAHSNQDAPHLD